MFTRKIFHIYNHYKSDGLSTTTLDHVARLHLSGARDGAVAPLGGAEPGADDEAEHQHQHEQAAAHTREEDHAGGDLCLLGGLLPPRPPLQELLLHGGEHVTRLLPLEVQLGDVARVCGLQTRDGDVYAESIKLEK